MLSMQIVKAVEKHPFLFSVSLTAVKTVLVDLSVQKYVERRETIDWRRAGVFLSFGTIYLGAWQYALFSKIMPRVVPGAADFIKKGWRAKLKDREGLRGLGMQLFLENGINNPILYFPIFYSLQEVIDGGDVRDGIVKYRHNMKEDLIDIWRVWVPAQIFNFAFSPLWLRVPFVACVSTAWTAYVSFTRGSSDDNKVELLVRITHFISTCIQNNFM